MTVTQPEEVLDFEKFSLRRFGPENNWIVMWKTTGDVEYLGTSMSDSFVAQQLADRLEEMVRLLKENKI